MCTADTAAALHNHLQESLFTIPVGTSVHDVFHAVKQTVVVWMGMAVLTWFWSCGSPIGGRPCRGFWWLWACRCHIRSIVLDVCDSRTLGQVLQQVRDGSTLHICRIIFTRLPWTCIFTHRVHWLHCEPQKQNWERLDNKQHRTIYTLHCYTENEVKTPKIQTSTINCSYMLLSFKITCFCFLSSGVKVVPLCSRMHYWKWKRLTLVRTVNNSYQITRK